LVSHGRVGNAKHPIPGRDQECLAFRVVVPLSAVHLAVELDGKTAFDAAEVKNERSKRMLATELHPGQTTPAERRPKQLFCPRLASAQVTSGGHIVTMTRLRSPWHGTSVAQPVSLCFFTFPK
jgi:hypothetical protein